MAKVEVKPVVKRSWHEKSGKDSFKQPVGMEVLYDSNTGAYATGLTEEEAKKYGKTLGVDLSANFNPAVPHPYWSSQAAKVKLLNQTMIFDDTKPADFVKIKNMKASKLVANSLRELEEGKWPDATHVIFSEEEDVEMKATKVQKKSKCYAALADISADAKSSLVQILAEKTVRGKSPSFIDVEIDNLIETKPDQLLKYLKMDKEEVYTRAAVLEALHRNVLHKEGTSINYMDNVIGMDFEEAVAYFQNPQNQKLKVAILEKLTA